MKAYSGDLRAKIVEAVDKKEGSLRQIAKRFKVSLTFIWLLIKRFMATGSIEPKPHSGGKQAKIGRDHEDILKSIVEEASDMTLKELCDEFGCRAEIKVSRSAMCNKLKKLRLTKKKKTFYDPRQDREEVHRKRAEHFKMISGLNPENVIVIDETGTNRILFKKHGRGVAEK
ncbi:MAG: transposase [Nitrospirae bacterium]|nr:transposase [Nitrospirota bacterium]